MSEAKKIINEWRPGLDFWFGSDGSGAGQESLWWEKQPENDEAIRQQFGCFVNGLAEGGYRSWLASPEGRLAAIIVIDQFSRNIFRNDPRAFANDHLALQWSLDGISCGEDLLLTPIQRVFFYMPLEHSESAAMQQLSVSNFEALCAAAPKSEHVQYEGFLDFARRHAEVIERFNRFPHRNSVLGRESTPQELAFLERPGSSF